MHIKIRRVAKLFFLCVLAFDFLTLMLQIAIGVATVCNCTRHESSTPEST